MARSGFMDVRADIAGRRYRVHYCLEMDQGREPREMNSPGLQMLLVLAAGFGAGLIYFWGLRLTLRVVQYARRPVRLTVASFAIRLATVAALLIWIGGSLVQLGLALLGFMLARVLVIVIRQPAPPDAEKPAA